MASKALDKFAAGQLIKRRREELGLTQDQVVENTSIPVATYVSELENGKVNVARSKHFPSLARYLRLSQADIRAINPAAVFAPEDFSLEDLLSELPESLQETVQEYGKRAPDLLDPAWQQFLASMRFRGERPETAEAWWDLYRDLIRHNIDPRQN